MIVCREGKVNRSDARRAFSVCRVWGLGGFMHLCFESQGCRFRKAGYCIMCDYGAGSTITGIQAEKAIDDAMLAWPVPVKRILLGSCGSVFDPTEIPDHVFDSILKKLAQYNIENVIFETHYSTVSEKILQKIRTVLPNATVSIEMGFESSDEWVLKHALHKYMDLRELSETMDYVHENRMRVILNVLLGAPGLTRQEQIEDAVRSCQWAFTHGTDEIVLFPMNIKPGTELWEQYREGFYTNPSYEMLLAVLHRLETDRIGKVSISWYGDRQEKEQDLDIIIPRTETASTDTWLRFFHSFMNNFDSIFRKTLIDQQYRRILGE